jgi:hypothetical protein
MKPNAARDWRFSQAGCLRLNLVGHVGKALRCFLGEVHDFNLMASPVAQSPARRWLQRDYIPSHRRRFLDHSKKAELPRDPRAQVRGSQFRPPTIRPRSPNFSVPSGYGDGIRRGRYSSGALAIYLQGDIDQSTNSLGTRWPIRLPSSPVVEPL